MGMPTPLTAPPVVCGAPHPDGLGPCVREPGHSGSHGRAHGPASDFKFLRWES